MMGSKHYHAGWNTEGYMPEDDPAMFTNRKDAVRYVSEEARLQVEQAYDIDIKVEVSKRGADGDYWVNDGRALDTHYWVTDPCYCDETEEEMYS
jgi:hypothetical protein